MTERENEILSRLIRNKFEDSQDNYYCLELISIARKLDMNILANEMQNQLN
jgi:hypothetical protein